MPWEQKRHMSCVSELILSSMQSMPRTIQDQPLLAYVSWWREPKKTSHSVTSWLQRKSYEACNVTLYPTSCTSIQWTLPSSFLAPYRHSLVAACTVKHDVCDEGIQVDVGSGDGPIVRQGLIDAV